MPRYSLSTLFKYSGLSSEQINLSPFTKVSIINSKYWWFDFIGQFLVAARSVQLFGDRQNVSSSEAQDKQNNNCAVGQQ